MTAQSWGQSWLSREDYRLLRQVEREVYPSIQEMLAERMRAVPRQHSNDGPAALTLPESAAGPDRSNRT